MGSLFEPTSFFVFVLFSLFALSFLVYLLQQPRFVYKRFETNKSAILHFNHDGPSGGKGGGDCFESKLASLLIARFIGNRAQT